MILSDRSIRQNLSDETLVIDPIADGAIQPSSVDIRLADAFRVFNNHRYDAIDPAAEQTDLTELVTMAAGEAFVLHPGEFVLASTIERIGLPIDIVSRVEGKSSLGRLGLLVHATAGFIDAGFDGNVTLELSNVANLPIRLYPGMKIAQLAFFQLDGPVEIGYGDPRLGSKYQSQSGPTASAYHLNMR